MTDDQIEDLVTRLFRSGFTHVTERLALQSADGRELGFWSREAIRVLIRDAVGLQPEPKPEPTFPPLEERCTNKSYHPPTDRSCPLCHDYGMKPTAFGRAVLDLVWHQFTGMERL